MELAKKQADKFKKGRKARPDNLIYIHVPEMVHYQHGYGNIMEENPTGLDRYINPTEDIRAADMFIIDGIGRAACAMAILQLHKKPKPVILFHDYVGREHWYSWATQFFDVETYVDKEPTSTMARLHLRK